MNQTIEDRMQSIEDQLKEIRKELEESLARYKQSQYPFTNGEYPHYDFTTHYRKGSVVKWVDGIEMEASCDTVGNTGDWYDPTKYNEYGNILETKCLWDSIPVEKPMGLSCPCRKCSAYC